MKTRLALTRCARYEAEQVDRAVARCLNLLGGMTHFIRPQSKVLLKPNLLTDADPKECITTHPRVIEAIIKLLKPITPHIYIGDSPSVFGERMSIKRVYEASGINELAERRGVELVFFDRAVTRHGLALTDWIDRVDYIINIPKLKTHGLTVLTAAIKNLFGCVVGMHKIKIHRDCLHPADFCERVVDVFESVRPTLTIVDGIVGMEGDGPASAGTKIDTEFILAGTDAVAIDSIVAIMMGLFPHDIAVTKAAARRNLGESDIERIEVVGEPLGEFIHSNFKQPRSRNLVMMARPLIALAKMLAWYRMRVKPEACQSCGRCITICPVHAIQLKDKKAAIDYRACILCACCQESCPYQAITLDKSLLLRLLGV